MLKKSKLNSRKAKVKSSSSIYLHDDTLPCCCHHHHDEFFLENFVTIPKVHEIGGRDSAVGLIKPYHFLNDYYLAADALLQASRGQAVPDILLGLKKMINCIRDLVEVSENLEKENEGMIGAQGVKDDDGMSSQRSRVTTLPGAEDEPGFPHVHPINNMINNSKSLRSKCSHVLSSLMNTVKKIAAEKRDLKEIRAFDTFIQELNVIISRMNHARVMLCLNLVEFAQSDSAKTINVSPFVRGLMEAMKENMTHSKLHSKLFERNIKHTENPLHSTPSDTKQKVQKKKIRTPLL